MLCVKQKASSQQSVCQRHDSRRLHPPVLISTDRQSLFLFYLEPLRLRYFTFPYLEPLRLRYPGLLRRFDYEPMRFLFPVVVVDRAARNAQLFSHAC